MVEVVGHGGLFVGSGPCLWNELELFVGSLEGILTPLGDNVCSLR